MLNTNLQIQKYKAAQQKQTLLELVGGKLEEAHSADLILPSMLPSI